MRETDPIKSEIAGFYNSFNPRLLRDYVYGNRRIEAAIERVLSQMDSDTHFLLDVGCGIGQSSAAYADAHSSVHVLGVDISDVNIKTARRLFESDRVKFKCSDMGSDPGGGPFDLIALIDVYEHFPRESRKSLHVALSECLSPRGRVVLTTPSPQHQAYLAENDPDGLQIVDETVTSVDILQLASDLGAHITCLESVPVWRTNQYTHVVLDRSPAYEPVLSEQVRVRSIRNRIKQGLSKVTRADRTSGFSEQERRRKLVRDQLGVEVDSEPH